VASGATVVPSLCRHALSCKGRSQQHQTKPKMNTFHASQSWLRGTATSDTDW